MMNENKSLSIWQNVNAGRLLLTLVWACAACVDGYFVSTLESRRVRGILFAVLGVLVVLFVRSFKKLMSDRLQEAIEHRLGQLLRIVFRPAAIVIGRISDWLGIGRWRGWCEASVLTLAVTRTSNLAAHDGSKTAPNGQIKRIIRRVFASFI